MLVKYLFLQLLKFIIYCFQMDGEFIFIYLYKLNEFID